jgi:nucleotide-binding universal stress UspA family protein
MKILVYTDGSSRSTKALRFAADLKRPLNAELAVITVRHGTSAIEQPPPLGIKLSLAPSPDLPPGLQVLMNAARSLSSHGLFSDRQDITLKEATHSTYFVCRTDDQEKIPFFECFGPFIEAINQEIDRYDYDLLVIAPPRRNRLRRLFRGDTSRKLALELSTSVLLVRGGSTDSRFVVCADGSTASKRQFPLLKMLLPAIRQDIELLWVESGKTDAESLRDAEKCLGEAKQWLENCGKRARLNKLVGQSPAHSIVEAAGSDAIIMMGASLRHDVYRQTRGSLPIRVLNQSESTILLVKSPPEADPEVFKPPFSC